MKNDNERLQLSELGKETKYPTGYMPSILFPISRIENRKLLEIQTHKPLPFYGWDVWNMYELSWLNLNGKPSVALGQLCINADSKYIIESKSLKLYLNSLNNMQFDSQDAFKSQIIKDLSEKIQHPILLKLWTLKDAQLFFNIQPAIHICLDDLGIHCSDYTPNTRFLKTTQNFTKESLHSHLLKSNCPITQQPDWATLFIDYEGPQIDKEGLLAYIISFRNHNDFHEHCVEKIFLDILKICKPTCLTVSAQYTRRGGLDINPIRSTHPISPDLQRLVRQ